jgi:hypothetical protein
MRQVCGPVRRDYVAIREQFSGVVEENDAVAQQAPSLLGVRGDRAGRLTVRGSRVRTWWRVRAHQRASYFLRALVSLVPGWDPRIQLALSHKTAQNDTPFKFRTSDVTDGARVAPGRHDTRSRIMPRGWAEAPQYR